MMKKDETPNFSQPSLCVSCKYAMVIEGRQFNERRSYCVRLHGDNNSIPFHVSKCSSYHHKNEPYLAEMEEIAWLLVTKGSAKREMGFMRVADMSDEERRKNRID